MVRRRPTRRQVAYYLVAAAFLAVLCFVFFKARFALFLIPVCTTLAVSGVVGIAGAVPRLPRMVAAIVTAGLIAYSGAVMVDHNHTTLPGGLHAFRTMGEWFVAHTSPGQRRGVVVERKPYFSYFAQLEHKRLPDVASYDELMAYLQETGARYLYFSYVAGQTRPELAFLMDPQSDHPGLVPILAGPVAVLYVVEQSGE
jgi:hypothetical protein